jgi:hypothetical protein
MNLVRCCVRVGCGLLLGSLLGCGATAPSGNAPEAPGAKEAPSEQAALRRLVRSQLARYPRQEVQDLYKLLHQAALGSEHAVQDTAAARRWMERELATLAPGPAEPVVDTLSPDGHLARIHLRPYLAAGGDPEVLLEAFVRTANTYRGSPGRLERYWAEAVRMAAAGDVPFSPGDLEAFFAAQAEAGHPAVHHSAVYEEAYAPAYRVVALANLRLLPEE